jgi:hypothetical protein
VQFTRDPGGIAGALKKIAVYSDASYLNVESEEVSHMLFGDGEQTRMFSTHPPLTERISRVDPSFTPDDLIGLAKRIERDEESQAALAAKEEQATKKQAGGMFDAGNIVDQIGHPDFSRILMAAALAASIPDKISRAAHSSEWATEVLFFCVMDKDPEVRERQLLSIAQRMGSDSETRVRGLIGAAPDLAREQRLPLIEIAFPELKHRPPDYVRDVLSTIKELNAADGRVDVFEYMLAKIISQHAWESINPQKVRLSGKKSLRQALNKALDVIAVVARHGHESAAGIQRAFNAGVDAIGAPGSEAVPHFEDWSKVLDDALPILDKLKPGDKEKLVKALIATVMADNRVAFVEMELLRVVCALIHVPLPMITGGET